MKIRGDTIRELLVSTLFSSCLVGILTKLVSLDHPDSKFNLSRRFANNRFSFSSLFPVEPDVVVATPLETIHVGMILKNVWRPGPSSNNFKMQFVVMIRSLLKNAQTLDQPIHLLIMTDEMSVTYVRSIVEKFIWRDVKMQNKTLDITYDFFNVDTIVEHFYEEIEALRPYFTSTSEAARKYRDNLFMVAPFYHRVFPYDKFIMLDVDLKFRIDISELFRQFEKFGPDQLIGVGPDLAPHYRIAFRHYRALHPDTQVGEPGPMQGFNTGVVLFNFARIRENMKYNDYVNNVLNSTSYLAEKYLYRSHLGDQCFFTLLGMEHSDWFYNLPCGYNFQLDTSMFQKGTEEIFPMYHNCTEEPKIYHGNGGTEIPIDDENVTPTRQIDTQ